MRDFYINDNDCGQRLDRYLSKLLVIPKSLIYKYLRTGHIKVNKKKKSGDYILCLGDYVALFIDNEFFKDKKSENDFVFGELDVVFENEDILIVNKKAGVLSQPDSESRESLCEYIKGYLFRSGEYNPNNESTFSPALCNRLDMNTSGLIIAAKNAESLRVINAKIKDKEIKKYYKCLVNGLPPHESDILKGYIKKDHEKNISVILKEPAEGTLYVETGYKILRTGTPSLLEVELFTGRSHQIRAHMASIGCPICGDFKYGGGHGTQKLCAYKLIFDFKSDAGSLSYLKGRVFEINAPFN